MVPARFAPALFSLILSGVMSCIVCAVATLRALGPIEGFIGHWMLAWLMGWAIAFPVAYLFAPLVRRIVWQLTATDTAPSR